MFLLLQPAHTTHHTQKKSIGIELQKNNNKSGVLTLAKNIIYAYTHTRVQCGGVSLALAYEKHSI